VYSVQHASRLTGIPPDTLRMWERRYHVVEPQRSDAGYRLYDDEALRRLSAMRALVAAGWSPRHAAERVRSGGPPEVDRPSGRTPTGTLPSLVPLAAELDPQRLERVLTETFAAAEFEDLVDDWLLPALAELGTGWRGGSVSISGEHFVSAALQRHVAGALAAARPPAGAPRVVAGLARASRHELGILAFATVLRRAGVDVLYVGPDLPTESWAETVVTTGADAVVLAVPTVEDVPGVRDVIAAVTAVTPGMGVYVGGAHQDRIHPPAHPLGHTVVDAARRVAADLGAASPT
jgi:MerR family transcriptional regulator, light-induced transcriptional regulator